MSGTQDLIRAGQQLAAMRPAPGCKDSCCCCTLVREMAVFLPNLITSLEGISNTLFETETQQTQTQIAHETAARRWTGERAVARIDDEFKRQLGDE